MVFVANPPTRVMDLNLNPVSWGFGIADVMTLGLASGILRPVRSMLEQFSPHIENVDPVSAYIDFINLMTLGLAKEGLCSSLKTLEKDPMLLTHFMEHYYLISGALMTWRKVQSWLAPSDIPLAVREGTSS